jgi:hypothetical protein
MYGFAAEGKNRGSDYSLREGDATMSDGGWGGSCGGSEGGYGNNNGYGGDCGGSGESGCAVPTAVQTAIEAAGANCDMAVGSGVTQAMINSMLSHDEKSAGIGNTMVGSGVAIPRSMTIPSSATVTTSAGTVTASLGTVTTPVVSNTIVDLSNDGNGVDAITDSGGSKDTFVVGTDANDSITITGKFGDDADNSNTLYAGSGAGGDTLSVAGGSYNSLTDGSGGNDKLSVGLNAPNTVTNNYNLLQTSDVYLTTSHTVSAGDTLTVGQGSHNTLTSGAANGDTLSVGDDPTGSLNYGPSGNNFISAGNGMGDTLSVGVLGAIPTVTDPLIQSVGTALQLSSGNVLIAGSGSNDTLAIGQGDNNFMLTGSGNNDYEAMNNGSNDVFVEGNGSNDAIDLGGADPNMMAASANGLGDDTFSMGSGNNDSITIGTVDSNSYYLGGGQTDSLIVGTSNTSLVSFGDGNLDSVSWGTGNGNSITLGDGYNDSVNFGTGGAENCVTLGDGAGDSIFISSGNDNTVTVGNGNYSSVAIGSGFPAGTSMESQNLLQCGNGNFDVVTMGQVTYQTPYSPTETSPPILSVFNGSGSGDVLEAGNGIGDFLLGGGNADPVTVTGDIMVAGDGVGTASFNTGTQTWSGIFADTLTGNCGTSLDPGSFSGGDTYVLSCGGGDVVQDMGAALNGAFIVNFAGSSQTQSGYGGSGGQCGDDNSCGGSNNYGGCEENNNNSNNCGSGGSNNNYGGCGSESNNNNCGSGSQGSSFTAANAIDLVDFAASDASGTGVLSTTAAANDTITFGSDSLQCDFQSATDTSDITVTDAAAGMSTTFSLFGQFSAAGFSLGTDNGIANYEADYANNAFASTPFSPATAGSGPSGTPVGFSNPTSDPGLLITYSAPQQSSGGSCGGQGSGGCGGEEECGGYNSNPCSGGQSYGGSSGCGSSGGSNNCGSGSYGGECGSGNNIGGCGGQYESNCISSPCG